ncbi:MAG: hypothetical protein AAGF45_08420, partial [Pseudomonadota bacterium]
AHSVIVCAEATRVYRKDFVRDPFGFPPAAAVALQAARELTAYDVTRARNTVAKARSVIRSALGEHILLSPVLPMAPAGRHATSVRLRGVREHITNANIRLTVWASVADLPVAVAPLNGLAVQFTAPPGADEDALAAMAWAAAQIR